MIRGRFAILLTTVAVTALTACEDTGAQTGDAPAPAVNAAQEPGTRDVERPDVFEVTDRGLWDGRPSLGGVWVAHPDVKDPERVIIRNPANGQSVTGALFRRERENPGPLLQVSSDAAEQLGLLAGAPTELNVVVLRREEVEVEETPELNPVVADLDAPVAVASTPLAPVAGAAAAAIDAADAAVPADRVDVVLPPAPNADAAAADTAPEAEAAVATPAVDLPDGPLIQIGVFSVQANADGAAQQISTAGIESVVVPEEASGRTVWRVVAGAGLDKEARDAAVVQVQGLGFVDAFVTEG